MKPIQILMDEAQLVELDRVAKRRRSNRSKVIRAAVTSYLGTARTAALEEQHRKGYEARPQQANEIEPWEDVQAWPED
jgi:metal-responsive CopG/Arc/MetJ family transcriptional regulator